MIGAVKHRGPDNQDTYLYENVALGHARLSIIDLSTLGHQPMHTVDGRYTLTYNGEIYNYKDIKTQLESKGYKFVSSSDTEVLLYSYVEWGAKCVEKINGMFAFAILDRKEQLVFLARDRYGIKPLYFGEFDNTFLFGSEIKSIEQHSDYKFEVNEFGLKEYFTFQNFLSSQTLNKGVEMFPAGHWATLDLRSNKPLCLTQYWDFNFREPDDPVSEQECAEELDYLFEQAVKRQLMSDVPLGSYLSGGMDSGSITAVAATNIESMHTFTCGFDMTSANAQEVGFDERDQAQDFADFFGTQHHEKLINHVDMEQSIEKIAWHLDEPRVGQSYPNYYAAELARTEVKVVLSGAGGDELFAGYPWRYYRAIVNSSSEEYLDKYYQYWQRLVSSSEQSQFFKPIWSNIKQKNLRDTFKSIYKDSLSEASTPEDYINESLYFEAKTFMHGLLVLEDKLSMAHSLESRVPILDNDLVDFAMKIPARYKLKSVDQIVSLTKQRRHKEVEAHFKKTKDGKLIFREAMQKKLPKSTAEREKQGFSGPDASWFKRESAGYITEQLKDKNAAIYNYIDYTTVDSVLDSHFNDQSNSRLLIWSLLNVQSWLESHS